MKLRKLQMFSLFMCELSLLIWNDTYKIMVGCPSCTYPSIHFFRGADSARSRSVARRAHIQAFAQKLARGCQSSSIRLLLALTLKIAVGCQSRTYPSIHTETCTRVGLLGPRGELLERASNTTSRHQTLCKALRRNHLVSTIFEAIAKKKVCHCLGAWDWR